MAEKLDEFLAAIEPAGDITSAASSPEDDIRNYAICSIAVSLKRIADVAEATAMGLYNYDPTLDPHGRPKNGR